MQDDADTHEHKLAAAQAPHAEIKDYGPSASYSIGELLQVKDDGVGVVDGLSKGSIDVLYTRTRQTGQTGQTKLKARNR